MECSPPGSSVHEIFQSRVLELGAIAFSMVGFPDGASGKEPPAKAGDMRCRFDPWVRKILWRRKWQRTLVFLPKEFMDREA